MSNESISRLKEALTRRAAARPGRRKTIRISEEEYDAVAQVAGMKLSSASYKGAKMVLVDGLSIGDAARELYVSYALIYNTVGRIEKEFKAAYKDATGADYEG